MRKPGVVLTFVLFAGTVGAFADPKSIDCGKKSLADAVGDADKNQNISFTGVCAGPIVIRTDGVTITGIGSAIVDGGGSQDAITIAGAHGVSLNNIEVRNGLDGIVGSNGAHFALTAVNSHDNRVFGISLQTTSSAVLSDVVASRIGVHGLDIETGSAATVTKSLAASFNGVFGINVNGSSITFSRATVTANSNALGIQIATGANAFINDSATVINVNNNHATGLTVVSGAHMVSFGGTINAFGNPVNGVSVNSKGGLDLDAASTLNSSNNGDGILMQEASVMTVFNTPQFSGAPGFTTINVHNNTGAGLSIHTGSTLTLVNQARINSNQNTLGGLVADNGVGLTLVNSNIAANSGTDIQLTFGSRADLQTLAFGSYTCDKTVLVRGTSGIICPH